MRSETATAPGPSKEAWIGRIPAAHPSTRTVAGSASFCRMATSSRRDATRDVHDAAASACTLGSPPSCLHATRRNERKRDPLALSALDRPSRSGSPLPTAAQRTCRAAARQRRCRRTGRSRPDGQLPCREPHPRGKLGHPSAKCCRNATSGETLSSPESGGAGPAVSNRIEGPRPRSLPGESAGRLGGGFRLSFRQALRRRRAAWRTRDWPRSTSPRARGRSVPLAAG